MSECEHYWMRSRFYEADSVCEHCNMHMSELLGKAEKERDELKAKVEDLENRLLESTRDHE